MTAVDIDRKLCLTAALIGARTRKDLAAAFHAANPRTSFDVERANKWLQGRARPREKGLYDDWALVIGLGRSGAWIAECATEAFLDALASASGEGREVLLRRARAFGGAPEPAAAAGGGGFGDLAGCYVSYSYAWSPYFTGRLIRGALTIAGDGRGGLVASYVQHRAEESIAASGEVVSLAHGLLLDLRESRLRTAFQFTLFPPLSLASVLGGLISGPALLGAGGQPSVSRVVAVRLPAPSPRLGELDCLMEAGASLAADLAGLGAGPADAAAADRLLAGFLAGAPGGPFDHVPIEAFRPLVAFFDREWVATAFQGREGRGGRRGA